MKLKDIQQTAFNLDLIERYYFKDIKRHLSDDIAGKIIEFLKDTQKQVCFFNKGELQCLEAILSNEYDYHQLKEKHNYLVELLKQKWIIYDTGSEFKVYEDIYDSVLAIMQKAKEEENYIYLQEICVGLCNAYGAIEKNNFLTLVSEIYGEIYEEELENVIHGSNFFSGNISELLVLYKGEERLFYCYRDLDAVDQFLKLYGDATTIPEHRLNYEQLSEYSIYGVCYSDQNLQDLLKKMHVYCYGFNEVEFIYQLLMTLNTRTVTTDMQLFVYNTYDHHQFKGEKFFDLLKDLHNVLVQMPSWKSKAFPLSDIRQMITQMENDILENIENQYHMLGEKSPLERIFSDDEEDEDDLDGNVNKKNIN